MEAVVLLVGMVDLVVTEVVLALQANRDREQTVVQVEQSIMMVIFQQLGYCHQERPVVK